MKMRSIEAGLSDEEISIALQRYLEAETRRRDVSDRLVPADFLNMLLSARASLPVLYTGCEIPPDRGYLDRIAQVACERHTARHTDQDVPMLIIAPIPLSKQRINDLLGDRLNYAMIFAAESIYFQDTVHALAVDSRGTGIPACDQSRGVNVLGAHIDWITSDGGSVKRALLLDETGLIKEMAFGEPVPIHVVQVLHLPKKRERQLHKELSIHFRDRGIPQLNPFGSSERADDKAWTHALWDCYGQKIVSPKCVLIPQHSAPKQIAERVISFVEDTQKPDVVVQPNRGTEGYKVERFDVGAALSLIVEYISEILTEDDAIVRERRGNIRYISDSSSFVNAAFRINVAWNGSEFAAESGYAQAAKDDMTFPASRGRGGTIVDINEALANLYYPRGGEWIRFIPTGGDVAAMKETAINAAYALNAGLDVENYLKLMGIDIMLEVKEPETNIVDVTPVALEANPRPAGLSHSSEILGVSDKKPQPRISMEIFRFITGDGCP